MIELNTEMFGFGSLNAYAQWVCRCFPFQGIIIQVTRQLIFVFMLCSQNRTGPKAIIRWKVQCNTYLRIVSSQYGNGVQLNPMELNYKYHFNSKVTYQHSEGLNCKVNFCFACAQCFWRTDLSEASWYLSTYWN